MNIAHLKYAVEVEKTASITKAAENLFMGQPNLSRGIKELEETLGVKIFKRTSKGIVPTPQGEEFLGYAKSILAQIEEMESLYKPEKNNKLKFSISVPRASYIADAFSKFVREADMSKEIEFSFKETNAMRAIRNVVQENYGLAIVRYQTIFESFFTNMLRDKGMKSENIWEFEYQLLISKNDPLSQKDVVDIEDLSGYIEICHGDPFVPSLPMSDIKKAEMDENVTKRVYVYSRGSQLDLLATVPHTYMWVSPTDVEQLERYELVLKPCRGNKHRVYRDILTSKKEYKYTASVVISPRWFTQRLLQTRAHGCRRQSLAVCIPCQSHMVRDVLSQARSGQRSSSQMDRLQPSMLIWMEIQQWMSITMSMVLTTQSRVSQVRMAVYLVRWLTQSVREQQWQSISTEIRIRRSLSPVLLISHK